MKTRSFKAVSLVLCALILVGFSTRDYEHLIGAPAPAWTVSHWINSEPMELADLRGKVVLVRWWTGPHCPFCRASAAALNEWNQQYQGDDDYAAMQAVIEEQLQRRTTTGTKQ
jgi:thiol-disulfide isomerase/thioredoxin